MIRQWTIYDHPADFPTGFVVREWTITADGPVPGRAWTAPTILGARLSLPPEADTCLGRHPDDDPTIVETWM